QYFTGLLWLLLLPAVNSLSDLSCAMSSNPASLALASGCSSTHRPIQAGCFPLKLLAVRRLNEPRCPLQYTMNLERLPLPEKCGGEVGDVACALDRDWLSREGVRGGPIQFREVEYLDGQHTGVALHRGVHPGSVQVAHDFEWAWCAHRLAVGVVSRGGGGQAATGDGNETAPAQAPVRFGPGVEETDVVVAVQPHEAHRSVGRHRPHPLEDGRIVFLRDAHRMVKDEVGSGRQ